MEENEVKVDEKQLELERKTRMRDNLKREQEMFIQQIPELQKRLEIHDKTVEILKDNNRIMQENFRFLKPTWAYEGDPEYIENVRKLNVLSFEKAMMDWDAQRLNMSNTLKSAQEQVEASIERMNVLNEEIETLTKEEE